MCKSKGVPEVPKIVALHTKGTNELLDYYLTIPDKIITQLHPNETLFAYVSVPITGHEVKKADFEKIKAVGSGGFSKVYKGKILCFCAFFKTESETLNPQYARRILASYLQ